MSRNPIWNYFNKVESDATKAQCIECSKLLSLGSDKPSKQTVHGLKCHLEKCHAEQYAAYSIQRDQQQCKQEPPAKKTKTTDETLMPKSVQVTITSMDKSIKWSDDNPSVQHIDKAIMDLIVVDMLPYSIVEGDAFKRLNFADPCGPRRYQLKSEKYFRTTLMPATYDKVSGHVRELLLDADWVSFTTDGWTNPTNSCSLLSFTGHFVHKDTRRKVILSAMVLEQDHTGAYLSSKLNEAVSTWNLSGKIHMGIRDNASNMVSAMRIANIDDFGCMAHTLQLVLHDALFTQTSVENVIKKSRKIVTHFKHSEQACRHLSECQHSCDTPAHHLVQDVETRWNSTYLMLQRLAEQRKALTLYSVNRGGIDILTKVEWELVERVNVLLKPFYDATLEISRDDACISVVIPLVTLLLTKMQTTTEDQGLKQMKAALRDAIDRRFGSMKTVPNLLAATLLDPRFKDMYFSKQEKDAATETVLDFLRQASNVGTDQTPNAAMAIAANEQPASPTSSSVPETSLWEEHDKYAAGSCS
jgi:hypothetical protein